MRGPIPDRNCKWCGDLFKVSREAVRYCSWLCSRSAKNKIKEADRHPGHEHKCVVCSKTYHSNVGHAVYCGSDCKREAKNLRRSSNHQPRSIKCVICEAPFQTSQLRKRFCSVKCKNVRTTAMRESRAAKPPVLVACTECGQDYWRNMSHRKVCSKVCKLNAKSKREREQRRAYALEVGRVSLAPVSVPKPKPAAAVKPKKASGYEPYASPKLSQRGVTHSGYSESRPRDAQTTISGCPHCRAAGMYQGRVLHASFCREAVAS